MIRATIRRLGALLLAATTLFLAGCDRGVKDPNAWLHENISYLNDVVARLRESSIIRVQDPKYENAAKYSSSDADAALYDELKKFIDRAGVISIEAGWLPEGDTRVLKAVFFHVKEIGKLFELSEVSIVYTENGLNPEPIFQDGSCTKAESPSWFICTWNPR